MAEKRCFGEKLLNLIGFFFERSRLPPSPTLSEHVSAKQLTKGKWRTKTGSQGWLTSLRSMVADTLSRARRNRGSISSATPIRESDQLHLYNIILRKREQHQTQIVYNFQHVNVSPHTDKKEKKIYLMYKEIQMGSGANLRKGFLSICGNAQIFNHIWGGPLVIYDFAPDPNWISLYMRKVFSFLSVH